MKKMLQDYVDAVPARIQRIILYKYIKGFSWEQTADKIGRNVTGESVRKETERFFRQNADLSA